MSTLLERVKSISLVKLGKDRQAELAELINLLPLLAKVDDAVLNTQALIAMEALLLDPPNLVFSQKVVKRLGERLRARSGIFFTSINQGSAAVRVVLGLAMFMYVVMPLCLVFAPFISKYDSIFGMSLKDLGIVSFAGALGSIVSIMVRLHQFSTAQMPDRALLLFTGFFKPAVGISFALFLFFVLRSGLLPIAIQPEKTEYFFGAISFMAGFSERFAQDIVRKTESAVAATVSTPN